MNIASDVKNYLDSLESLKLFAPIGIDSFGIAKEAIIVRADPSNAVINEYIDGSTTGIQMLSFYSRSKSAEKCITALNDIKVALDKPEINLTEVLFIRVAPRTLPSITGKEETGEFIYSMVVEVAFDSQNPYKDMFY